MNISIEMSLSGKYQMIDIITAFHYGLQLAEEQLKANNSTYAEIIEDIRKNEPSIQKL